MGMGIGYKIGNENGKEWEYKKPFPIITSLYPHHISAVVYVTQKFGDRIFRLIL